MVGCMGPSVLSYLKPLISAGMFASDSAKELVEFMNFLGLVIHKFKRSIYDTVNEMFIPLMEKTFFILNQAPSGTDEAQGSIELRKAYLTFMSCLFNSDLDGVLISDGTFPFYCEFL